jgi:hypothetical protein
VPFINVTSAEDLSIRVKELISQLAMGRHTLMCLAKI